MGKTLPFERKDSWDVCWAADSPNLFAVMEKTRMSVSIYAHRCMPACSTSSFYLDYDRRHPLSTLLSLNPPVCSRYVFDGFEAQEPTLSSGYLASFTSLTVKAVLMDDVMLSPDKPTKDLIVEFETKVPTDTQTHTSLLNTHIKSVCLQPLRDMRELMERDGRAEAYARIEANPHSKLWRILAEHSLNALDLPMADKVIETGMSVFTDFICVSQAMVKCGDYPGIQYVKRLNSLGDKMKQRAEVCSSTPPNALLIPHHR